MISLGWHAIRHSLKILSTHRLLRSGKQICFFLLENKENTKECKIIKTAFDMQLPTNTHRRRRRCSTLLRIRIRIPGSTGLVRIACRVFGFAIRDSPATFLNLRDTIFSTNSMSAIDEFLADKARRSQHRRFASVSEVDLVMHAQQFDVTR